MKKTIILLVSLVALFLGCTTDTLQPDISIEDGPVESRDKKFVPFKGTVDGVTTYEQGAEGRCAELNSAFVTIGYEGAGNITHMGEVKLIGSQCGDPNTPVFVDDRFVLIAANKDELHFVGQGIIIPTANPLVFDVDEDYTIKGGTGRFINAEGQGKIGGQVVFTHFPPEPGDPPIHIVNIFHGLIAY